MEILSIHASILKPHIYTGFWGFGYMLDGSEITIVRKFTDYNLHLSAYWPTAIQFLL